MVHFLIGLVLVFVWLAVAVASFRILWRLLVRLPLWCLRSAGQVIHDAAQKLPGDWLFLCGFVALSAVVCAVANPGWGIVALGVGATVLCIRQNYGGGCN